MTHYETLGVTKDSSKDEIKQAYRKAARKEHPDMGGDTEKFIQLHSAYVVLSSDDKRREYDNPKEKPKSIEDEAIESITSLINAIFLESPEELMHVDFILKIKILINSECGDYKKRIKKTAKNIGYLFKIKKRLSYKGTSSNIILERIEETIKDLKQSIRFLSRRIKISKKALIIINDYRFDKYDKPSLSFHELTI